MNSRGGGKLGEKKKLDGDQMLVTHNPPVGSVVATSKIKAPCIPIGKGVYRKLNGRKAVKTSGVYRMGITKGKEAIKEWEFFEQAKTENLMEKGKPRI